VLPWIGVIPLQQLSPVDLNQLYRRLLESDRKRPGVPQRHPEAFHTRATELRAEGHTHEVIAAALREEFPDIAANITRFAVAALLRRGAPKSYVDETQPGLSPRTVRYIHTIIHAALKDALRWSRVVRNVADAATPPSVSSAKSPRVKAWTAEQLRAFLQFTAENRYLPTWIFLATSGCRRGEALGLRWADVDLDNALATIGHQVTSIDHRVVVKDLPKTKRDHVIRRDAPRT
jgi:integrase